MDDVTTTSATLPGLIEQAAAALATATTAAEVLDAKSKAGFAYPSQSRGEVCRGQERSRRNSRRLPQGYGRCADHREGCRRAPALERRASVRPP